MLESLAIYPNTADLKKRVLESLDPSESKGPCVSIYIPRQTASLSPAQRKFRFVRLVKEAERRIAKEYGPEEARSLMSELWRAKPLDLLTQSGLSLALFHERDFTGAMHLPVEVAELLVTARSFHVKPVLGWLQTSPHFHLISLSSSRVKLYEGTPWDLNLLLSVDNPLTSEREERRPIHTKETTRQFFLRAEKEIHEVISRNRSPVVIAGVSWLHPIYRRLNRDPDLLSHAIHGNVEKWTEDDLKQAVFDTLGKLVEQSRKEAVREFRDLSYSGQASDDLGEIAKAAVQGRVRKIMVASDQLIFGSIHPKTGALTLDSGGKTSDDVLDDLAETVLAKGGKVLCIPSRDLPTASPAAALMTA